MPYVEGFTVHDADAHVMELPGEIDRYVDPGLRAAFSDAIRKPNDLTGWAEKARAQQDDPNFRAGDEDNLLLRKNYQALGAFRREDRPRTLDLLGFAS
ncbi:MAG: amidohydrolase, partial [Phenylobacterium sp.]|nr:amidohydrolase [Phenylobacterium sp.]